MEISNKNIPVMRLSKQLKKRIPALMNKIRNLSRSKKQNVLRECVKSMSEAKELFKLAFNIGLFDENGYTRHCTFLKNYHTKVLQSLFLFGENHLKIHAINKDNNELLSTQLPEKSILSPEYLQIKDKILKGNKANILHEINSLDSASERIRLKSLLRESRYPAKDLNWEVLPPSMSSLHLIKGYYSSLPNRMQYDLSRLDMLYALNPSQVYRGKGKFKAYHVFCFSYTMHVALECPKIGNALYLLNGNWRELSHLTKQELTEMHGSEVIRIVHHDMSLSKLRNIVTGKQ